MPDVAATSPAKPTIRLAIFAAHIVGAVGWWWLMPHGFPWLHARWWANDVGPMLLVTISAVGCFGLQTRRELLADSMLLALAVFWTAVLASALVLFPVSAPSFRIPLASIVIGLWLVYLLYSTVPRTQAGILSAIVLPATLVGGALPWTQRAPEPQTLPLNESAWTAPAAQTAERPTTLWSDSDRVQVLTATGEVTVRFDSLMVEIAPLLSFDSRSPDRCWTVFAPRASRQTSPPRLTGLESAEHALSLSYRGDSMHLLRIQSAPAGGGTQPVCEIAALSQLAEPVYSHLNSYTTISVRGHKRLTLGFSPCPTVHVAAEPADYPVGRPARFAYLEAVGRFHVVEASSGEKGPFRELAGGPLARTEPLGITLYDSGRPVATIVFKNWAAQASVDLSPTAGWGVPMNSIEFSRSGNALTDSVEIWLSLAATSVGRGWDSVGHRAGTYANRVRLEGPLQNQK